MSGSRGLRRAEVDDAISGQEGFCDPLLPKHLRLSAVPSRTGTPFQRSVVLKLSGARIAQYGSVLFWSAASITIDRVGSTNLLREMARTACGGSSAAGQSLMPGSNPYHEGELRIQRSAGVLQEAQRIGRVISRAIMKGAPKFIAQQPMAVLGSVDGDQNVWASILFGKPGFMAVPDDKTLEFDLTRAGVNSHDPFWKNIEQNPGVGSLIIEFATRQRLRINGDISRPSVDRLRIALAVAASYPNCPKYIQRRRMTELALDKSNIGSLGGEGDTLDDDQQALISEADTFFVASAHPQHGVDVSHRGGPRGFVAVLDESTLRIPDYVGNTMFNTLGNFSSNPRAGLIFLDFDHGRTLQLIGRPEILMDQDYGESVTGGTRRFWTLQIEHWREMGLVVTPKWQFVDYSPYNPELPAPEP